MNRILRCALALAHTVIEYVRIDDDRVVVGVRPWRKDGLRCPVCGKRCGCYDRSPSPRSWRAMDLARSTCLSGVRDEAGRLPGARRSGRGGALGEAQVALHARL
ncbi:hypothetical protein [Atopobium sp. oral taxon 416]|uniref:hypothetical protein n=1 Tax=Atopobium sp. oral taxon 416 TaxID=712157 RepID=UPI001BA7849D|nr:hypothetical protein [Atopobium sp. oral taxon 416]QUC04126.1 hypothetical protein J4859_04080 [Atopobium sp. oral taxon 416]QUC04500.1 hypothetical protein J4859_06120 [Atopobium sp. oral taxon 416]